MINLYSKLQALFATRDQGVTAVEYALILVGVVAVVAGIIFAFGGQVAAIFQDACGNLHAAC